MGNVAFCYRDLKRRDDAIAMSEKEVEFYRRVLPEGGRDHPALGECSPHSLSISTLVAPAIQTTFQYQPPPSPPPPPPSLPLRSGTALYYLSCSYKECEALPRALQTAREALAILKEALEDHPFVDTVEQHLRSVEEASNARAAQGAQDTHTLCVVVDERDTQTPKKKEQGCCVLC